MQLVLWLGMGMLYPQVHQIQGNVVDANSGEPLVGVSVFFDGTSIGTVTDRDGAFVLTPRWRMTSPVILQYLGYETRVLSDVEGNLGRLLLKPKAVELDEVVLEPDTWSRKKKERVFLNEFLGSSSFGRRCEILNLETVRLYYSKSENSLQAFPAEPLTIVNRALGYTLSYNLLEFKAILDAGSDHGLEAWSVTFTGLVRFSPAEGGLRSYTRNRQKAYRGSVLHFMRALSNDMLRDENFGLYFDRLPIARDRVMELKPTEDGLTEVIPKKNTLYVLYDRNEQSFIKRNGERFYIDRYGNFGPASSILFGGAMGEQRVGHMLPLDYRPQGGQ